ncbi:MAG: hypothetical protein ACREL6_04450 [Gemmatimonadales bacterium]
MGRSQAKLKPMDASLYPALDPNRWYDVAPLFPGVTQRMVNLGGDRLTRLNTPKGMVTVKGEHFEFRHQVEP